MDKTLVGLLKETIENTPTIGMVDGHDYSDARSFQPILDAIEASGYKLEAHQRGVMGTFLCLTPRS